MGYQRAVFAKFFLLTIVARGGLIYLPIPLLADPKTSPQTSVADQSNSDNADCSGEDFTRPQTSITARFQYRTSGSTSETKRGTEMPRFNAKIDLAPDWYGSTRAVIVSVTMVVGTWSPLRDSVNLFLNAVPSNIEPARMESFLAGLTALRR